MRLILGILVALIGLAVGLLGLAMLWASFNPGLNLFRLGASAFVGLSGLGLLLVGVRWARED